MTSTRVLIIDDHALFAEAIRLTLEVHGTLRVGITHSVEEPLPAVHRLRPDLPLVDIGLPDGNGLALGKRIMQEG